MSRHSTVLIAGGGIAGLALALTCHQIGVPFRVFESVTQIKPLGVGINLQPSAVRELADLGLESALDGIGVRTRDYGMYTQFGLHIWTEPRGLWAGYHWPQYSVHRGQLHMMLLHTLISRAGPDCIECGWRALMAFIQPFASKWHPTKASLVGMAPCSGGVPRGLARSSRVRPW